jgi:Tfp pilus assembly protein PilF
MPPAATLVPMLRYSLLLFLTSLLSAADPQSFQATAERAVTAANGGHCADAVPILARILEHVQSTDLKRSASIAGVKCSMQLNDVAHALSFLTSLNREFPHDPSILYLSTHVYSDLSVRASNELLSTAPSSPEVHELNAEALEATGKWREAADEYRAVLQRDPKLPGIHYRLGRLLLSQPDPSASAKDDAKHEFEQEIQVDPTNAGSYFVLGELARQAEQWPVAIDEFSRATKYDGSFAEAYLGLGRAYLGAEQPQQAIAPLQTATKLQGDNPETHFQLATAYQRAGRKAEADHEFAVHREVVRRAQSARDNIKRQASGSELPSAQQ